MNRIDTGWEALRRRERALAGEWRRARGEMPNAGMLLLGIAVMFLLAAWWEPPQVPQALKAFVLTFNLASLGCLGAWCVAKLLWLPARLRLVRSTLARQRAD